MLNPLQFLRELVESLRITNIVDIGIITSLIYFVLVWFRGTRAFKILTTLLGIGLVYVVASYLGLILTSILFQYLWAVIIVVVVIVFQPEIREMLDRASPIRFLSLAPASEISADVISETVRAAWDLSRNKVGALIVFIRADHLDNLVLKGKILDSVLSAEALTMIFQKNSPLHDGAVLVRNNRIQAASCILPLSRNETLSTRYGTRHRAALGLAERSDAVCVVVSEETGRVSLAVGGDITPYAQKAEFKQALEKLLTVESHALEPGFWERAKELLWSDTRLKILSLLLSLVLWIAVVGPKSSELGISVPIQYTNLPAGMEITGKWMDKIDVRLKGPESGLANLKPGAVRAVIDLSGVLPGLNYYRITNKNIQVPPGVTISDIRPSDLRLHIETAQTKKMAVTPALSGALPERTMVVVTPSDVRIRAVQDDLKKIVAVTTEPVSVSELIAKGKVKAPVVVKPEGLKIELVEPQEVTLSLKQEQP